MTQPKLSYSSEHGRMYAHPSKPQPSSTIARFMQAPFDPEDPFAPKPSITNITGMMNEDFLPGYYAKLVAEHAVENLDQLRYQVDKFGPQIAVGALKAVPSQPNANAAIGDEIHAAIDDWCKNPDNEPTFTTVTAAHMYEQWLNFVKKYPVKILKSEFTIWSYKYGYAGTGDLLWELPDGTRGIVDTKSGNNVYPKVAMQTSALAHGDVIIDNFGNEEPMIPTQFQNVMHIRPRSVKLYELQHTDRAFKAFLACRQLFEWKSLYKEETIPEEPMVMTQFVKGEV